MKDKEVKIGNVTQTFADGSVSGPYKLKELPNNICWQWTDICQLYTLDDKFNHTAHINTLTNV